MYAKLLSTYCQRRNVLGQAAPAEPQPSVEKLSPDPIVVTEGVGQQDNIAAGRLAHLRHPVDEADLGRQKRIRGDLDQLTGGDVASNDGYTVADRDCIDLLQHLQCMSGVCPEDQPVRTQRVL